MEDFLNFHVITNQAGRPSSLNSEKIKLMRLFVQPYATQFCVQSRFWNDSVTFLSVSLSEKLVAQDY